MLREALSVFFYHHIEEKHTIQVSAELTVNEVLEIWKKTYIPTARSYDIVTQLIKIHSEWQGLKKWINRRSEKQIASENKFCERLDRIFDIAHQDAEKLIQISEDLAFLIAQRDGGYGYMAGEDKTFAKKLKQEDCKKQ